MELLLFGKMQLLQILKVSFCVRSGLLFSYKVGHYLSIMCYILESKSKREFQFQEFSSGLD